MNLNNLNVFITLSAVSLAIIQYNLDTSRYLPIIKIIIKYGVNHSLVTSLAISVINEPVHELVPESEADTHKRE